MKQKSIPYCNALNSYLREGIHRWHLPGHSGGRWLDPALAALLQNPAADTTSVLYLDDIHYPEGALGQAQDLASDLYGVEQTWFLINGSTGGVQTMALATLVAGDEVIVPRNAHRSLHSAILLSGARPHYAPVPYDDFMGAGQLLTATELEAMLERWPRTRACLFESANGFGAAADVQALVESTHRRGVLTLVDEAWGAHWVASPRLPLSACSAGADLIVQSAHKTLNALDQAAWLHRGSRSVDGERITEALRFLQSSSPSSLLMASLDCARRCLAERGREEWERTIDRAVTLRARIEAETPFRCPPPAGTFAYDPTRIVISGRGSGCDGPMLECRLRCRHQIQVDMSDLYQAFISVTPAHTDEDIDMLIAALQETAQAGEGLSNDITLPEFPAWEESVLTPRHAWKAKREVVPWEQAAGRISAVRVTAYPPGMALICPGERIGPDQIEYLRRVHELELPVEGLAGEQALYCVK